MFHMLEYTEVPQQHETIVHKMLVAFVVIRICDFLHRSAKHTIVNNNGGKEDKMDEVREDKDEADEEEGRHDEERRGDEEEMRG